MSLTEDVTFDNRQRGNESLKSQRPSESVVETFTFDKEGHIESGGLKDLIFKRLFLSLIIILVASLSFGLGRLSKGEREGIKIEYDTEIANTQAISSKSSQAASAINAVRTGEVVASSKGTKYHYPHCPGAKQISEANKLVFPSQEAAEASGYTLATNCKPK